MNFNQLLPEVKSMKIYNSRAVSKYFKKSLLKIEKSEVTEVTKS